MKVTFIKLTTVVQNLYVGKTTAKWIYDPFGAQDMIVLGYDIKQDKDRI
jgi:hypothetical protein